MPRLAECRIIQVSLATCSSRRLNLNHDQKARSAVPGRGSRHAWRVEEHCRMAVVLVGTDRQ